MAKTPAVQRPAPEIELPDQDGATRRLSELRGKWVLVYFYPRDDTPGCTLEACGVRDEWARFRAAGVEVLGISADSSKSHRKFADKYSLPFTLLADTEKRVIQAWGAWGRKKFMGREFDGILRQSFLVDPRGLLAKVYPKVKPAEHAAEVLADVAALSATAPAVAGGKASDGVAKKTSKKTSKKTAAKAAKKVAKKAARRAPRQARGGPRGPRSKA